MLALCTVLGCFPSIAAADIVRVRLPEGSARGFLVVRALDGREIGRGELQQKPVGAAVESRLTLRFQNGSLWDELCVFSQRTSFRLERYAFRQQGPSFPAAAVWFDRRSGRYEASSAETPGGSVQHARGALAMPADLYNGLTVMLLKNTRAAELTFHTAVFTPEARVVTSVVRREGDESVSVAGEVLTVHRYVARLELGGLAGLLAPLIGKEPPVLRYWLIAGDIPVFAKFEGAMFLNGPVWRLEQTLPRWSK